MTRNDKGDPSPHHTYYGTFVSLKIMYGTFISNPLLVSLFDQRTIQKIGQEWDHPPPQDSVFNITLLHYIIDS